MKSKIIALAVLLLFVLAISAFADSSVTVVPGSGGHVKGCVYYTGGRPVVGAAVTWYLSPPGLKSGGHYHDTGSGRPNVIMNTGVTSQFTDATGCATVDVLIPPFSGVYQVHMVADGMQSTVTITASVGGLMPLQPANGLAPLSSYYDPAHYASQWCGKFNVNVAIDTIAGQWNASGYAALYGGMAIYRYSLLDGGYLDNNTAYWALSNPDPHPSGYHFDVRNPTKVNPVAQQQMSTFLQLKCGVGSVRVFPGSGTTLANANFWHVDCAL